MVNTFELKKETLDYFLERSREAELGLISAQAIIIGTDALSNIPDDYEDPQSLWDCDGNLRDGIAAIKGMLVNLNAIQELLNVEQEQERSVANTPNSSIDADNTNTSSILKEQEEDVEAIKKNLVVYFNGDMATAEMVYSICFHNKYIPRSVEDRAAQKRSNKQ